MTVYESALIRVRAIEAEIAALQVERKSCLARMNEPHARARFEAERLADSTEPYQRIALSYIAPSRILE